MNFLRSLIFLVLIAVAVSEVVQFKPCKNYSGNCVVHEVRIDPCPQAAANKPCRIRRRRPARISFDFTPGFESDKVDASVFWEKDENTDLELEGMDSDACKYSTCPYKSDQKNTYDFELPIQPKFPLNDYEIKWKLNGSGQECCFTTFIKIVR